MATAGNNLSDYDIDSVPEGSPYSIGIVVSEWNQSITGSLLEGAKKTLAEHGVKQENIIVHTVPGTYELPIGAQWILKPDHIDAVIAIGSVIKGETPHFDFVCQSTANGVREVSLKYNKPAIFCVLTDNNLEQAQARSGGKLGNKGIESAIAALKMCDLNNKIK